MPNTAKCPACKKILGHMVLDNIDLQGGRDYKGVTYACPYCDVVISVQMDPLGLNADLVLRLMKALKR